MPKECLAIICLALCAPALADTAMGEPVTVFCKSSPATKDLESFNYDLYFTGHPMGGLTQYSGMFDAEGSDLPCGGIRGSLDTNGVGRDYLNYVAEGNCLQEAKFELRVETSFYDANTDYPASLTYQVGGPLGPGPKKRVTMKCRLAE